MINVLYIILGLVMVFCFQVIMVRHFFRVDEIVELLHEINDKLKNKN